MWTDTQIVISSHVQWNEIIDIEVKEEDLSNDFSILNFDDLDVNYISATTNTSEFTDEHYYYYQTSLDSSSANRFQQDEFNRHQQVEFNRPQQVEFNRSQ